MRKLAVPDVTLTNGIAAGTAVIMYPFGILMLAVIVPGRGGVQLTPIVSGAPKLSVSVTELVQSNVPNPEKFNATVTPLYVLVEELLVDELLEGVAVWSKLAVAVTVVPLRRKGSGPLTKLKVPVKV
jgi:hypothetical protein